MGKGGARRLLKARILLEADKSDAGADWNDGQIAAALDTSVDRVGRTRKTLVEEGLDAALTSRYSPNSARKRIFDGAGEAKLIALACSPPPKGAQRVDSPACEVSRRRAANRRLRQRQHNLRTKTRSTQASSPKQWVIAPEANVGS
jgi:poly-gamma-glutamate capsule biosynthesis protein CapA/YwtB (metallophosphatase superfamily)